MILSKSKKHSLKLNCTVYRLFKVRNGDILKKILWVFHALYELILTFL